MSGEKEIEVKEEEVPKEVKGLFARIRTSFYTGVYIVSGGAGALLASKKLFFDHKQDTAQTDGRSPASIEDESAPWRINMRLAQLQKDFDAKAQADDLTHKDQNNRINENRKDARDDVSALATRLARIEAQQDKTANVLFDIKDMMERDPKRWSGLNLLDPNKKAN